ncbi:MAG: SDR family NAD(P)-dependent oxidoreductase [Chloroflexota bacterium]
MKLQGKVALITGASRGIGRAVAEEFAREGAQLFITGQSDQDALNASLASLRSLGAEAAGGLFDVGRYADVERMADAVQEAFGRLDVLVNNAGGIKLTPLLEKSPEEFEDTIRTHLLGTFYCTQVLVNRFMKDAEGGKIINITSPAAVKAVPGLTDYGSAKAGIAQFTKTAAKELLQYNIQVNCILPVAETRMTDALDEFDRRVLGDKARSRKGNRPGPEVLAPSFVFFACADSDYVTGQILAADGGAHL